ncbi:hypothetical protein BASA60_006045 [Batrachochytrium salamandrivorans]|nr:hypothetical protein BASA60_006045 [Batrachochytrium salamandrivorans]
MSTFNTEVWDPMLLSTSGSLSQSQSQSSSRRNTHSMSISMSSSGSGPMAANSNNGSTSSLTNGGSSSKGQSDSNGHHGMSNVLSMSMAAISGSHGSKDLSDPSFKRPSPTSPVIAPKKTGIMYRIFQLGDATPPEHHEMDPHDLHNKSLAHVPNSLWGRSRRSFSGSEAESDDPDSDDSGVSSNRSGASERLGRKSSIGEAMDHIIKRAGNAPFRQKALPQLLVPSPQLPQSKQLTQQLSLLQTQSSASQSGHDSQRDRVKRQPSKKGIFSMGAGDDSSDFESDLEESSQRKPTRGNLFKDLLHGARPRKTSTTSKPSSPSLLSPSGGFGHDLHHSEPSSPYRVGPQSCP